MSSGFGRVAPDFRVSRSGSSVRVVAAVVAGLALACAIAANMGPRSAAGLLQAGAGESGKMAMEKAIMEHANTVARAVNHAPVQTPKAAAVKAPTATVTQKKASAPVYPHETQAQRDAEAMAAAQAFQQERAQAEHPNQVHIVAQKASPDRNEESMQAAQKFQRQHNIQPVEQQSGKSPAQIDREQSIAQQVENENEKTANAVVYTDSQADAEIDAIKKELRQRDRSFRQSVQKERQSEIAASVEKYIAPIHEQSMAQMSNKQAGSASQEEETVQEERGAEAKRKQQLIEAHLSEQVKDITNKAAEKQTPSSARDEIDDVRSEEEEKQNSKHLQMEIAEITGQGLPPRPLKAKAAKPAAVKAPPAAPKASAAQTKQEAELQKYMSSAAFKHTEQLALKVEEQAHRAKP